MPTATPFTALGAGNGFPFCPSKVNVADRGDGSPYDYWTTLSGWSKVSTPADDAAKATSISESLTLAMKIFWNSYLFSWTATGDGQTADLSNDADNPYGQPFERICSTPQGLIDEARNSNNQLVASVRTSSFYPAKFYYGNTDDENNFIGYGFRQGRLYFANAASLNASGIPTGIQIKEYSSVANYVSGTYTYSNVSTIPLILRERIAGSGSFSIGDLSLDFYTY